MIARVRSVWGVTVSEGQRARPNARGDLDRGRRRRDRGRAGRIRRRERAKAIAGVGAIRVCRAILTGGWGEVQRNHNTASITRPRGRRQEASNDAAPLDMIPDAISDFDQLTVWSLWLMLMTPEAG